jgi:uncharacterized protein
VARDAHHGEAAEVWRGLVAGGTGIITTSYVLLETYSVLQRRYGLPYVNQLRLAATRLLGAHWVTRDQHEAALAALLAANRRDLSLVDCASFIVMRELGVETAFAFDPHFAEQGFTVIPGR